MYIFTRTNYMNKQTCFVCIKYANKIIIYTHCIYFNYMANGVKNTVWLFYMQKQTNALILTSANKLILLTFYS